MDAYSYEKILEVTTFLAMVVTKYGEVYLPLFERAQKELRQAERRKKSLELARKIAIKDVG